MKIETQYPLITNQILIKPVEPVVDIQQDNNIFTISDEDKERTGIELDIWG